MTDEEQTAAFPDLPVPRERPEGWVCSNCGNDAFGRVHVDTTRPSLDARYAIGMCDDCSPAHKGPRGMTRGRVQLVRSSSWSREMWLNDQRRKGEERLLARYRRGDVLTPEEVASVRALVLRNEAGDG